MKLRLPHRLAPRMEGPRRAMTVSVPALPAAAAAVLAAVAVAACGASTSGSSPAASPSSSAGVRRANAAAGTLVQVSDTTLVLSTSTGDVTISYSSTTPITLTATGSYADIQVGSCINATGTKDATGAVTASSVTITSPVNGSCSLGSFVGGSRGAFPGGRPGASFRPRATPSGLPANVASVRGTVAAVNVTQVTVQKSGGTSQTITVPTTIKVSTTSTGSASDLTQGACVAAVGPKAASGTVTARTLVIAPAGPSGCFTGGPAIFGGGGPATS